MIFAWRDQPAALLEQHRNPRVTVPNFQDVLDRYAGLHKDSCNGSYWIPGSYVTSNSMSA